MKNAASPSAPAIETIGLTRRFLAVLVIALWAATAACLGAWRRRVRDA